MVLNWGHVYHSGLGFGSQEPGVLTVGSHIPVEDVQEKFWKGYLRFNSSEE